MLLERLETSGRRKTRAVYLLDASAIYPLVLLLRERFLEYSSLFTVLDLTVYEVGNVLWKEHRRGRVKDVGKAAKLFQEIFRNIHVLRLESGLQHVLELSVSENLTFYDASYLYAARSRGLRLVTEDQDLQGYPESITVKQLLEELGADWR